jgi:hypothetical protein
MPSREIIVPSFDFSAFYYPQILEALIIRKRIDVPELTDESDFEPFIQLLRSFALVGHLNNVLLDMVANENTLPTSSLVQTVRDMLNLIDYKLASASPATTELVYELSKVFTSSFQIVSENAQAATEIEGDNPVIYFESLLGITIDRTDQFTSVQSVDGGTFSDHTTQANSGSNFTPWPSPVTGDALYFGHSSVMWDKLNIDVVTAMSNIVGIWEYYENDLYDIQPTSVTDIGGGNLEFDLTSLLGTSDRRGTVVRVSLNETGVYEDVTSTWSGSKNIATTGLLGQTSPSTDEEDYTIGSEWTEFALESQLSFSDGTADLIQDGDVEFVLPQNELNNWQKTEINSIEAFWIRYRIITVSGPSSPTLNRCGMDTGKQYAISDVVQGRTVSDDPLGSSNGAQNQSFETTRDYFIDGSETVTIDSEEWTRVDNFLSSGPQDKHYILKLGDNDRATIRTGDGVNGRIPSIGQGNISIEYRYNAEEDGNVGANTVTVDKTGLTYVNSIFNPRQAGGWAQAEGATDESLERAKLTGPASLRVKEVALNGDDAIVLTQSFVASDGSSPFSRATFIEEGFGEKTLELIVVGSGGVIPTGNQLEELALYFNGDKFANPQIPKRYVANNEVVPVAFEPKTIDVTAVVTAPEGVTAQAIINGLNQVVQPEALKSDGVTYEWSFGDSVPVSRLIHEIFSVDDRIEDVDISVPSSDVALGIRELPVSGTFSITIQES